MQTCWIILLHIAMTAAYIFSLAAFRVLSHLNLVLDFFVLTWTSGFCYSVYICICYCYLSLSRKVEWNLEYFRLSATSQVTCTRLSHSLVKKSWPDLIWIYLTFFAFYYLYLWYMVDKLNFSRSFSADFYLPFQFTILR